MDDGCTGRGGIDGGRMGGRGGGTGAKTGRRVLLSAGRGAELAFVFVLTAGSGATGDFGGAPSPATRPGILTCFNAGFTPEFIFEGLGLGCDPELVCSPDSPEGCAIPCSSFYGLFNDQYDRIITRVVVCGELPPAPPE